MTFRLHQLHRLALAAAFVAASGASHALNYEWGNGAGNWSVASNWLAGSVPIGGAGTSLTFGRHASSPFASWGVINNLGGGFQLNSLELASSTWGTMTLANASGSGLAFTGPGAHIDVTGVGVVLLANDTDGLGLALNTNVVVNMGLGQLFVTSPISGAGALVINGPESSYGLGQFSLTGDSTFSGGVTLNSGNLGLNGGAGRATVGTGTFTINGGVLSGTSLNAFDRTGTAINVPVQLNADLRVNTGYLTFNGAITLGNAGASLINEGGNVTLNTALGITGATVIGVTSGFYPANSGSDMLILGGNTSTQGTLLNTSSVTVAGGSTLVLDNTTTTTGNLANRINDSAAVNLMSGTISLRSASTGSSETLGATKVAGHAKLEAQPGTAGAGMLTLTSLERVDRGVLLVRGTNLGNNAVVNHGSILIGGVAPTLVGGEGAAGSTTVSIVPWIAGNNLTTSFTGELDSFTTYSATTGLRPLNLATEYATALGLNANDNVLLSGTTVNNAAVTVNALNLRGLSLNPNPNPSIIGNGSINVTSGAVMFSGNNTGKASIGNNLNFGSAEAVLTTNSALAISGTLTGRNGLTLVGPLQLSGDNSGLSGPLTITQNGDTSPQARIDVSSGLSLPGSGLITIYSGGGTNSAGVGVLGNAAIDRDFSIRSGNLALHARSATTATVATFSGNIAGSGGVIINGRDSVGLVRLTGNNTYTGSTRLAGGYLEISSDSQLGNGGGFVMAVNDEAKGLQLAGNWTTSRIVDMLTTGSINTFAYNAVLNGPLTGRSALTKLGSGALTINGSGTYNGVINADEGSLFVNGTLPAKVIFNGNVMGGSGRVSDVNFLGTFIVGAAPDAYGTFSASSMTMMMGSHVAFDLGHDLLSIDSSFARGNNRLGGQITFDFTGAQAGGSYELVHFGSTSFSSGDFVYTGLVDGLIGSFAVGANSLTFNVSAVPEPGTTALFMAGLGAAALVLRRRIRR